MTRDDLLKQLQNYKPTNEQEERDLKVLIDLCKNQKDIFTRENLVAHFSSSAWVVDSSRQKVLMAYHNIYKSWSWLGGHADGEEDLLNVAIREVKEESGVQHVKPVTDEIFSVEIITVDGHEKRGKYVSSHLHLNVTYLLEANEGDLLTVKEDENSGVKWFEADDVMNHVSEPWMNERVYSKLINKTKQYFKQR